MPTEEERRRRCIIDPDSCPGGPPPPAAAPTEGGQIAALGEELWWAYKSPHDQPWSHLSPNDQAPWRHQAERMLGVWSLHLLGGLDHKALYEEAASTINHLELELAELREKLAGKK